MQNTNQPLVVWTHSCKRRRGEHHELYHEAILVEKVDPSRNASLSGIVGQRLPVDRKIELPAGAIVVERCSWFLLRLYRIGENGRELLYDGRCFELEKFYQAVAAALAEGE